MRNAIDILEATDIADRVSTIEGDLAATGLGKVAAIMSLEDEFRIDISDRDSEALRTVGEVLALIRSKLH